MRVSLFLDQFHQRFTLHICGLRGPENGHISLFLDQFDQRLTLHICGLRGPENDHISLFLDQFDQRLTLHICGLRGPEKGPVLTSGASRPCSAVECVMRCSLNENSTVRTFFGTLAANPTVGDYNVGQIKLLWCPGCRFSYPLQFRNPDRL